MIDLNQFKNGALIAPVKLRDYRLEKMPARATALPSKFSLRDKIGKIKNQGASSSCVGQATAYYVQLLNLLETGEQVEMSARDIYSLIYEKGGGAYIKKAFQKICNSGCVEEKDATSYENGNPPSEAFMTSRQGITKEAEEKGMTYLAKKYFTWNNTNLELYKRAIIEGNGMVSVSWGNNIIWQNARIELPDNHSQMTWCHGILFTGWDDEKQELEFVNSWNGWGDLGFGYLPYKYITEGYVANPYTLIDLPNDSYVKIMSIFTNLVEKIKEYINSLSVKK
jgi:C1A family cysteine protease